MKLQYELQKTTSPRSLHITPWLVILTMLLAINASMAQGWRNWSYFGNNGPFSDNEIVDIAPYADTMVYMVRISSEGDQTTFRLPFVNGEKQGLSDIYLPQSADFSQGYDYRPAGIFASAPDTIYILATRQNEATSHQSIFLFKYARRSDNLPNHVDFDSIWRKSIYNIPMDNARAVALVQTADDQLAILGEVATGNGNVDLLLAKVTLAGDLLWVNVYPGTEPDTAVQLISAADGGYYMLSHITLPDLSTAVRLIKTDAFGEVETAILLPSEPNDIPHDIIQTSDGALAIAGQAAGEILYVLKVDATGQLIWRQNYTSTGYTSTGNTLMEDLQQHLVVAGSTTPIDDYRSNGFLVKLKPDGTPLWERVIPRGASSNFVGDWFNDIVLTPSGGYLMGGARRTVFHPHDTHSYVVKTDSFGIIFGGNIHGNVFRDLDLDCVASPNDQPVEGWIVQAIDGDRQFFGNTDADGNFFIPVQATYDDPGNYIVSLISRSPYWEACQNDVPVFVGYLDTVQVNFAIQAVTDCPYVEVDITSTRLRLCDTVQVKVDYCNIGTAIAEDSYVEVSLDPSLHFVSATTNPSEVSGDLYTFPIGDLGVFECGEIVITGTVDCDSVALGEFFCLYAQVFPDTFCIAEENWTGALVNASYNCDGDSIQFLIQNVGTGDMAGSLPYVIIEDAVLLMQGQFDLDANELVLPQQLPKNGTAYTLIAQQEPGAPGAQVITVSTVECEDNEALPPFAQYNGNPYLDSYCSFIVGSFDPNDKQAYPPGIGDNHEILPNTDVFYTIRFQNTGTDTAFRVVIRDTLSPFLNLATVRPIAASHPYQWNLENQSVVFNFYDIALPDSTTNPAASQGYIRFAVSQYPHLPVGTYIGSSASIYFDFNAPIQTNVAFQTIGDFIQLVVGSTTVTAPSFSLSVAPNPVSDGAWIRLEGAPWSSDQLQLELFDAAGRRVAAQAGDSGGFWFNRGQLPAGLYIFTINHPQAGPLATGKLVIVE